MSDECLTVTFFRGLSASGKSTLARELAAKTGAIRLNLDALREMAGQPWSQENEKFIQAQQDEMALAALRSSRSVIVDNTHLVEKGPRRLATRIWEEGLNVNYDLIDVTVSSDECRHRNMVRRNSPTADDSLSVPDHVVVAQADLWAKEVKRGPWTIESIHRGLPEIVPVVPDSSLPEPAIIALDGTLCNAAGKRGPYDFDLCGGDELHQHVLDFVNGWAGDMDSHHPGLDPLAVPAQQTRHCGDVVTDREVREQADLLDHVADVAPELGRSAFADALAVQQDVALGDVDHAVD